MRRVDAFRIDHGIEVVKIRREEIRLLYGASVACRVRVDRALQFLVKLFGAHTAIGHPQLNALIVIGIVGAGHHKAAHGARVLGNRPRKGGRGNIAI